MNINIKGLRKVDKVINAKFEIPCVLYYAIAPPQGHVMSTKREFPLDELIVVLLWKYGRHIKVEQVYQQIYWFKNCHNFDSIDN